ncbi:hypothetical protein P153DRAFT_202952 [Dothidotthia symphoricarpi CBS 119687]|uniref:ABM domain-containing protein n=1 Tax=Dothidotthia symphoricarpi CBS 119687 TaxID=1392245 RepID=A0A6A6AKN7_9PLEO|nr:uncharacterized protein P153DRAFT_202952 [Dothidotthia symphoricarpi CBS 119687]KAF2131793.1 hypothetical protein P153DRAFT_202952 [Dothidotthia symphoricarpi CBS 119687]
MPVTEIALCRMSADVTMDDPELRSKLAHARAVMENFTQRQFYLLQQVEDPTCFYIIGEWDSVDQHVNEFIPGSENQAILESLKDLMTLEWLLHLDVPHADLPLPKTDAEREKIIHGGMLLCIMRTFIAAGKKDRYQDILEVNNPIMQQHVTGGKIGNGWRIDKWLDKDESFLFIPWESSEQYLEFKASWNLSSFADFQQYVNGVEFKHARILDI